jgi:DNA-binding transcriptional MerR regulator
MIILDGLGCTERGISHLDLEHAPGAMLQSMSSIFSPSQAAAKSGFSLDTLRYYERIGLLDDIERAPSGHRRFRDNDLEWLGILRCLRDTGMPIAQMRQYAELTRGGQVTLAERLNLLTEHDTRVQQQIALLLAQHEHLQEKIDWYRSQMPAAGTSPTGTPRWHERNRP